MATNGGTIIYGTNPMTPTGGTWGSFIAGPAGATISAWTGTLENIAQLYSVALPANFQILDPSIKSITLSAGSGIAYYNV